jgi:magnesium transporter
MPVVDNAIYFRGARCATPSSLDHTFESLDAAGPDSFCWIGLLRPEADELAAVAKEFGLHPLAIEDTVLAHQRPKLDQYGDVTFVVLRPARYVDPVEVIEIGEIHLFIGHDFVITVRHALEPDLGAVRRRLEDDPELLARGPYAVLYAVLDTVVDDYLPVLDGLQNDLDQIEVQLFDNDPNVSKRIYTLTREVIEFARAVDPLQAMLAELRGQLKSGSAEGALELRRALRDVADHTTRVVERVAGDRELLTNMLTVNTALVAQAQNERITALAEAGYEQNEAVKRISSWAAILFAPSLIAAIYGMNFRHMPELRWQLGYPLALSTMVLSAVVLFFEFKRRKWI